MNRPPVHRMSPEAEAASEEAMRRDREHFRRNPGALSYTREYVPGELFGLPAVRTPDDPVMVLVVVVRDDLRLRAPIFDKADVDRVRELLEAQAGAMRAARRGARA